MQNIKLINGYEIKELFIEAKEAVEILCEKCSDYYMLSDGVFPSKEEIGQIFIDLPPDKNIEDKFVFGVYTATRLVAIVDIVRDFPTTGEWMLGLMHIEPEERGKGLGKIVHKAVVEWAKDVGALSFRIGVIEENYKAKNFWASLGYVKIKDVNMDFQLKTHLVSVMRLLLFQNGG